MNSIRISFTRDSVCMGDDCMAPHEEEMLFKDSDTWIDLLNAAAGYVPSMPDYEWEVVCGTEVLGTLTSESEAIYRVESKQANALISSLPKREIFCRKKEKTENRKKSVKAPHDMITDGVLAYGVNVGRFVYEEEGYTVYVISDLPHIGASDVFMVYQITKADYEKLLPLSCSGRIPQPPVSHIVTDACRKEFLCGESVYCKRYYCALDDVDKALAERIPDVQASLKHIQPKFMNYCPKCGKKNDSHNYCSECGTKLLENA